MARYDDQRDIVYVERDGGSLKPILFGLLLGVGFGLLFAPQSGEETRRALNRRLRRMRALAEEKVDELSERMGTAGGRASGSARAVRDEPREAVAGGRESSRGSSAREELERRLADARGRRRAAPALEDEEQGA